jgi:hypothetical protein
MTAQQHDIESIGNSFDTGLALRNHPRVPLFEKILGATSISGLAHKSDQFLGSNTAIRKSSLAILD